MASPQVEHGYTRIADELLDKIIWFPFTARQYKVVFYLIRNTYGFHRTDMILDYIRLADSTGISRNHCATVLGELRAMKVVPSWDSETRKASICKDYSQWRPVPSRDFRVKVPSRDKTSPKLGLDGPIQIIKTPPLIPPGGKASKKIKTRVPEPFLITTDMTAWVKKEFGEVPKDILSRERDSFVDRNKGEGKLQLDWVAAWRNWMRNWWKWGGSEEMAKYKRATGGGGLVL